MKATPRLAAATAPEAVLSPEVGDELAELEAIAPGHEMHILLANTRKTYEKAWQTFTVFCLSHDLKPLPDALRKAGPGIFAV